MATFHYKAYTAQGVITAGTIVADGVDAAIDALYGSGLTPFETYGISDAQTDRPTRDRAPISQKADVSIWKRELFESNSFSLKELTAFTVELATLTNSGLPLDAAFRIIAGPGASPKTVRLANGLLKDVLAGAQLSEAMAPPSGNLSIGLSGHSELPARPVASPARFSSRSPNCWRDGSKFAARFLLRWSIPSSWC